jgi:hypothetical protein
MPSISSFLTDRSVQCWRNNYKGNVGDGSTISPRLTKVSITFMTTATRISLGTYHSCALLTGGLVQCWGDNTYRQLGDGSTTSSLTPVFVVAPCDASVAPINGSVGDCSTSLTSASTCQPTCNIGYTVSGPSSCFLGLLTEATCSANPCDASHAPTNGGVGDCKSFLASGSTCQPT